MKVDAISSVNSINTYIFVKRINQKKTPLKSLNNDIHKIQRYSRDQLTAIEIEFKKDEIYSESKYHRYKGIYGQFVDYLV